MSLLASLVRRYRDTGTGPFCECRRCSAHLSDNDEECPRCGSGSIATYDL